MRRHRHRSAGKSAAQARHREAIARRQKLRVEALEDRRLLAVLTVTDLADAGAGTLRDAITTANGNGEADEIVFSVTGTIDIASQLPAITDDLTITGPGAALLTIDAGGGTDNTVGNGDGYRIFNVDDGLGPGTTQTVVISGVTLTGADTSSGAGAIVNREDLTLLEVVVSGNRGSLGGALENRGTATILRSTLSGNSANNGGAIENVGESGQVSTVSIAGSTISGNSTSAGSNGAIHNFSFGTARVIVSQSTIAGSNVNAIWNRGSGTSEVTINNSLLTDPINNSGTLSGDFNVLATTGATTGGANDIVTATPSIAQLADYGGPTPTHALLPDSPALNAGQTSPVAAYRFEETGTFAGAIDMLGEHPGEYQSFPSLGVAGAPNVGGSAALFDGLNDHVTVPRPFSASDLSGDAYTVELWFNADAAAQQSLLALTDVDGPEVHAVLIELNANGTIRFLNRIPAGVSGGDDLSSSVNYTTGQWHHLAAVRDGAQMRLYLDGAEVGSQAASGSLPADLNLTLGRLGQTLDERYYDGFLDEVVLHNRALSADEVAASAAGAGSTTDQRGAAFDGIVQNVRDIGAFESDLLTNPGFEADGGSLRGWTEFPAADVALSTAGGFGSTNSAELSGNGGGFAVLYQGVSVEPGEDLTVSVNAIVDAPLPAGAVGEVKVEFYEVFGGGFGVPGEFLSEVVTTVVDDTTTPGGVVPAEVTVTAPADAVEARVTLTYVGATGSARYDDVRVARPYVVDTVDDTSNSGLTLRAAINLANVNPGADTITFDPSVFAVSQTIDLASQLPTITDDLTITGPGADRLTIDAGGGTDDTVGNGDGYRIFEVNDGLGSGTTQTVEIRGLTLTGGDAPTRGGGILNFENLTLAETVVTGNASRNSGGGIYTRDAPLTVVNSTISGNQSGNGGGIAAVADLTVLSSTISGNTATGAGVYVSVSGGGVFNYIGTTVIQSSTITNNTAAVGEGSGVASRGAAGVQTEISGSIVAGNTNEDVAVTNVSDANTFVSNGFNLIGTGGGLLDGLANFNADATNVIGVAPMLGALADNGGPTPTHTPLLGSPAIDAGGGPIHFYRFEETTGTTAADTVGGDDGVYQGTTAGANATDVAGSTNSALFDGVDDHVQLSQELDAIGATSNTVEGWVRVPEVGTDGLEANERVGVILGNFTSSNSADVVNWEIHDDGQLRLFWDTASTAAISLFGETDLRDNQWHHVAFVRDVAAGRFFLYVDGVEETLTGANTSAGPSLDFTETHRIGIDNRAVDPLPFHGGIDELAIYDRALSAGEVLARATGNVDQRGGGFDRIVDGPTPEGARVDIGAVELQDDHGNFAAEATPIADGAREPGDIEYLADSDYFSFSATAGEFYRLVADHGGIGSTEITLYDTDGVTPLVVNNSEFLADDGSDLGDAWVLWQAPTTDTYFAAVREIGDDATGFYFLEFDAVPVTDVAVPSVTTGTIAEQRDNAVFRFAADAGVEYRVSVGVGSVSDPALLIYDTDGSTILASIAPGSSNPTLITFTAPSTGDFYAEVRDELDNGAGDFQFGVLGPGPDDHGDDFSAATVLATPSTTPGVIEFAGDADYFAFLAVQGTLYDLSVTLGSLDESVVTLYDTDGVTPLASDDFSGPDATPRIVWEAPANGFYFVAVRDDGDDDLGSYSLSVGPFVDDHGDDAGAATPVVAGVTTQGEILPAGDADYFSFSATAGVFYRLATDHQGIGTTEITLYDTDGVTALATRDSLFQTGDGNDIGDAWVLWRAPASGTYFAAVRGIDSESGFGFYDFLVDATPVIPVAAPSTTIGSIDEVLGNGLFSFVAHAGQTYTIDTNGPAGSFDTTLTLYDADGTTLLAADDDSGDGTRSLLSFAPAADGVYYAEIREFGDSITGDLQFNVRVDGDLEVTNTDDSGPGSLRQAVLDANAGLGSSITFTGAVFLDETPDVIALTSGEMAITGGVSIYGPGADRLTIDAQDQSRVFFIDDGTAGLNDVVLADVTLANGFTSFGSPVTNPGRGGTVSSLENLTIERSVIRDGQGADAGAVWVRDGSFVLESSTVSGNGGGNQGGALYIRDTSATIHNSTITGNTLTSGNGAAVQSRSSAIAISSSTIVGNTAGSGGAALTGGGFTLTNTILANNTAGGVGSDANGSVTANFSLIETAPGATITGANNVTGQDPLLGPLADNGGPTPTHALLPGSPAIDAGLNDTAVLDTSFTAAEGYADGNLRFQQPNGVGNGQWTEQGFAQVDSTAGTVTSTGGPFDRNMWDVGVTGGTGGTPGGAGFTPGESLAITFDYRFTLDADANRGLLNVGFRNEGPNVGNGFEARPQQGFAARFREFNDVVQFFPNLNDQVSPLEVSGSLLGLDVGSSDFTSDDLRFDYRATLSGGGTWIVDYFSVENLTTGVEYAYEGPQQAFFFEAPNQPGVAATDAFYSQLLVANGNTTAGSGVNISASALAARFALAPAGFDQRGPSFARAGGGSIDLGAYEAQGAVTAAPGDYNRDGVVNAADFTAYRDQVGAVGIAPLTGADGDGDGEVTERDYDVWRTHYGFVNPAPPPATANSTSAPAAAPPIVASAVTETVENAVASDAGFALLVAEPTPRGFASPTASATDVSAAAADDDTLLLLALGAAPIADAEVDGEAHDEALSDDDQAEPLALVLGGV